MRDMGRPPIRPSRIHMVVRVFDMLLRLDKLYSCFDNCGAITLSEVVESKFIVNYNLVCISNDQRDPMYIVGGLAYNVSKNRSNMLAIGIFIQKYHQGLLAW